MTDYIDPFGRNTIVEVLPATYNNRISFVVRKERQSVYESWNLDVARCVLDDLQEAIKILEGNT